MSLRGQMNKIEADWAKYLDLLKASGEVLWYHYEGITLRLNTNDVGAKVVKYTPDFIVMNQFHCIEIHEVKGFFRTQDKVRTKIAASTFPFRFFLVERDKKDFKITEL